MDDCVGIIFNENSSISKSIADTFEFKKFLFKNFPELIKKGYVKNKSSSLKSNINTYESIGLSDIPLTQIDKDGNLQAVILDVYDFNANSPNPAVNYVHPIQECGIGTNFFSLSVIKLKLTDVINDNYIIMMYLYYLLFFNNL